MLECQMTTHHCVLSRDYFDPKSLRLSRNQREAGIEHLEWADRVRPLRPLTHDIGFGVSIAVGLLFAWMSYFS